MKYLIKIDRSSVKKNPNAGQTHHMIPGKSYSDINGNVYRDVHTVYSLNPVHKYSYRHLPTEVECEECGAKFKHTELHENEFGDHYSGTVCPECGAWDCCEIKYEDIKDIMK